MDRAALQRLSPRELRAWFRAGNDADTGGLAPGYLQASITVVPAALADDFEAFCNRNPAACPLLKRLAPGSVSLGDLAPDADIRTDLPAYRVVDSTGQRIVPDIRELWRADSTAFVLGCSFSALDALRDAGVDAPFLETGAQQPVYVSKLRAGQAGVFGGNVAVSMLTVRADRLAQAIEVTMRLPFAHGAPVWVGDPAAIGVDLDRPLSGDRPRLPRDRVPVFWPCTQTAALAAARAGIPLIQHAPARMLVTDRRVNAGAAGA